MIRVMGVRPCAGNIPPLSPVGDIPPFQGRMRRLRKVAYAVFAGGALLHPKLRYFPSFWCYASNMSVYIFV
jgi:hypothetical protein